MMVVSLAADGVELFRRLRHGAEVLQPGREGLRVAGAEPQLPQGGEGLAADHAAVIPGVLRAEGNGVEDGLVSSSPRDLLLHFLNHGVREVLCGGGAADIVCD